MTIVTSSIAEAAPTGSGSHTMLRDIIGRSATLFILAGAVLLIVLAAHLGDIVLQRRVIFCLVNLVAVVGLYIFMGNSGVLNFSSVGFMAIGAYTSALLTMMPGMKATFLPDLPAWLAAAEISPLAGAFAAGGMAALVALVVGWPLMRLSGIGAGIATLSLLIICYIVLGNWNSVTGGQQSLMGLKAYVGLWTSGLWAIAAITIAFIYQETRFAIALRASREDEVAARASGIHIVRERLIAFVLGAFVAGVGGALFGHFLGTLRVENFYFDPTFLFISMLVVGGMRSLTGAVAGTVLISLLTEILRLLEVGIPLPGTGLTLAAASGLGDVALAAVMLLIILFRPQGITGGREAIEFFRRKNGN
ncbi:branched-chain amino acid ABC transporter permease [Rhizobium sp. KVB221]|uniref:Branched-chain amino acid ABC transporter permease n=1 Tax=Rhizobium setariae TaxID=2801340 RepID=A0A936YTP8_9HYPH|nr:branched-chain amino acid ABC transporter permease [Rhizobium setariae]MBL0374254.1 branched-chain amino acid ABC transporter permease [Rhizobium setariae]